MFNGKYELNHTSPDLISAFGISKERYKEIMLKLNAVANIYPSYIAVTEVWLNCEERFTDKELAFGLFALGKMYGLGTMIKKFKIKLAFPLDNLEGQLLKKLFEGKREIDQLTQKLLSRGKS